MSKNSAKQNAIQLKEWLETVKKTTVKKTAKRKSRLDYYKDKGVR